MLAVRFLHREVRKIWLQKKPCLAPTKSASLRDPISSKIMSRTIWTRPFSRCSPLQQRTKTTQMLPAQTRTTEKFPAISTSSKTSAMTRLSRKPSRRKCHDTHLAQDLCLSPSDKTPWRISKKPKKRQTSSLKDCQSLPTLRRVKGTKKSLKRNCSDSRKQSKRSPSRQSTSPCEIVPTFGVSWICLDKAMNNERIIWYDDVCMHGALGQLDTWIDLNNFKQKNIDSNEFKIR